MQHLVIFGYPGCHTRLHYLLQPFTGLRMLELEGKIGGSLIYFLSIEGSGRNVASDASDGARSEETPEMAVACPNLERLAIQNSDLNGEALMRIISERNHSARALKGEVRLLKHIEVWNCPGVSAETRRSLRLLRDQDV